MTDVAHRLHDELTPIHCSSITSPVTTWPMSSENYFLHPAEPDGLATQRASAPESSRPKITVFPPLALPPVVLVSSAALDTAFLKTTTQAFQNLCIVSRGPLLEDDSIRIIALLEPLLGKRSSSDSSIVQQWTLGLEIQNKSELVRLKDVLLEYDAAATTTESLTRGVLAELPPLAKATVQLAVVRTDGAGAQRGAPSSTSSAQLGLYPGTPNLCVRYLTSDNLDTTVTVRLPLPCTRGALRPLARLGGAAFYERFMNIEFYAVTK